MAFRRARLHRILVVTLLALAGAAASAACVYKSDPSSSTGEVCSAMSTFLGSCTGSATCGAAVVSDCAQISTQLSDGILNGLITCGQEGVSCEGGPVLASACVFTNASDPSPAQTQLATDYCAKCDPSSSICAQGFYAFKGSGASAAPVFAAPDPVVLRIDSTCIPQLDADAGATACAAAFVACARPILSTQLFLPTACTAEAGVLGALSGVSVDGG